MSRDRERSLSAAGGRRPDWLVVALLGCLVCLLAVSPAAAAEGGRPAAEQPTFAGLPLIEALLELEPLGLAVVFTSELVEPGMRVLEEPTAEDPRAILDQLLAPHGLAVEEGPGGTLVVVAGRGPPAATGAIRGLVRSAVTGEPLAGASVALAAGLRRVESGADGRFEMGSLEPGSYALVAQRQGYLPATARQVAVGRQGAVELAFSLWPVPRVEEEITVRPSRLSLLAEEPVTPLSLGRDEIRSLPHLGEDLFRALPLLPGITANDVTAQFHVRGGRRDEVRVLLDGQELYQAHHLQDFDNALSVVVADNLEGVDLATGAMPAEHGDRMGGVLDMTTSRPTGPRRSLLELTVVSAGASDAGRSAGGRGGWLASARAGSLAAARRAVGSEDPEFWDLFAKLERSLPGGQELRGHLLYAGDRLDFRELVEGESKSFDTEYDSAYGWLRHQMAPGRRLLVESALSWSRSERDRRGLEDEEEQSFEVLDRRSFDVLGLTQAWSWQAGARQTVEAGVEARRYEAAYDYRNQVERAFLLAAAPFAAPPDVTRFAQSFSGDHLALYASDRLALSSRLSLELGLRYDRHPFTGDTVWSPRLSAAWQVAPGAVLRGAWGRFHQSQRPYELRVEDGETRFSPSERSRQWVLGYEQLFAGSGGFHLTALRVEAYRRDLPNPRPRYESLFEPLNVFPEAESDRLLIVADSSRSEGVELFLRGAAGARCEWWLSYAYSSVEDLVGGRPVRRPVDQPHALSLLARFDLGSDWQLSLAWRYHTGWPTTAVSLTEVEDDEGEVQPAVALGPLYGERLPVYHRMDLRASRSWAVGSGRFTFFVDVQNLYDRQNASGFDLAVDEEDGLEVEPESWPGIYPSLGIRWEL